MKIPGELARQLLQRIDKVKEKADRELVVYGGETKGVLGVFRLDEYLDSGSPRHPGSVSILALGAGKPLARHLMSDSLEECL